MKICTSLLIIFLFQSCESISTLPLVQGNSTCIGGGKHQIPQSLDAERPYPDPFATSTTIVVDMPQLAFATVVVQNPFGDVIKVLQSGALYAGTYCYKWDGTNSSGQTVKQGIYLLTFSTENFTMSHPVQFNP